MYCESSHCLNLINTTNYHFQALGRQFPDDFQAVREALQAQSAENVVTGKSKAPAVRSNKRKATRQDHGREAVSFAPPVEHNSSQSSSTGSGATKQTNFEQNWGTTKITAIRQAFIDFMLLRFIVCCAIAASILDNGFFIDFVTAL